MFSLKTVLDGDCHVISVAQQITGATAVVVGVGQRGGQVVEVYTLQAQADNPRTFEVLDLSQRALKVVLNVYGHFQVQPMEHIVEGKLGQY